MLTSLNVGSSDLSICAEMNANEFSLSTPKFIQQLNGSALVKITKQLPDSPIIAQNRQKKRY